MKYVGMTAPQYSFGFSKRKDDVRIDSDCLGDYQVPPTDGYKFRKIKGFTMPKDNFREKTKIEETYFAPEENLNFRP